MVDIVIPIYNAFDDLQVCLESVLVHTPQSARIILINDASTDCRVQFLLNDIGSTHAHRVVVVTNDTNQGFVMTANRGMALSQSDVVLLNSDTVVTAGWLEKLSTCAASSSDVGTVTPFSNNAEICSYPVFCRDTAVAGVNLDALIAALDTVDDGIFPEIPTAVGFCMYIRRAALDRVGMFNTEQFGAGYGEENDFCMRASAAGFRHLLCTNALVVHRGGRSFMGETQALKERNLKTLLMLHPEYTERISRFIAADPIKPYRERVIARLASQGRDALGQAMAPGLLMITHSYGGGVDKHVMDLVELLADRVRVEVLRPVGLNAVALDDATGQRRLFDITRWADLVEGLQRRNYARAHIHHIHGYPTSILQLPAALGIAFDVTLHDFSAYCPQYSLTTANATYCGEPDAVGCQQCVSARPNGWNVSVEQWRALMGTLLTQAQRVISPSEFVASKVRAHYPTLSIDVVPHPPRHEWLNDAVSPIKVLILGGLSRAKGLDAVLACAWETRRQGHPITFTLLGYAQHRIPTDPQLPIHIGGEYADEDLPARIANERPDCIWFPGQAPEAYSYTLDVALASGLPIIANNALGAVVERVNFHGTPHRLLDAHAKASEIVDVLLGLVDPTEAASSHQISPDALEKRTAYGRWLTAPMLATAHNATLAPPLSALQSNLEILIQRPGLSLSSLYEQAVECGHLESRHALQQQVALIESDQRLLQQISEGAGKPWYQHLQETTDRVNTLADQNHQFVQAHERLSGEVAEMKNAVENYQNALQRQATVLLERDETITNLWQQLEISRKDKDAVEAFLRQTVEDAHQKENELRGLIAAAETTRVEMVQAFERQQQALHNAAEAQKRDLLERAATQQRELIEYYENSKSWRLTAPLRAARALFEPVLKKAKTAARLLQRGYQRWPIAYRILRDEGPQALAKRIDQKINPPAPPVVPKVETSQAEIASLELITCASGNKARVSIVIPVYGQHQYTYNCLLSIAQHTDLHDVEILVIDDASPEPVTAALANVQGVRWIRNPSNLGFIGSCNTAASQARGEFLVLLNNDVQVSAGWLEALLSVFELREDAGLVGAKLVYPDGHLQEAGGIVWQDGSAWNWGRNQDPEHPTYNFLRKADYCSGACLAIRMTDWKALDGFDRAYVPAYYEDADLAFRVRAQGKHLYYQPDAKIVHFEGVTSGTDESKGVKHHQVINQKTFFERWRSTLKSHRPNAQDPWAEATRWATKRVLVVEACMVTPDQDAGSVRMQAIMELMTDMGVQVSFVADNLEYRQPYVHHLQQVGVEVWHRPHIQSVAQLLEQRGSHYDVIIFCRHYIACQYTTLVRTHAPQAKVWFDTVDLHYLREERLAELQQSDKLAAIAAETKRQEIGVMEQSDLTFVVSPVERDLLAKETPTSAIDILSLIHEPVADTPVFKDRNGLLFVGGFQHPPNIDAVQWFIAEVWPLLIAKLPDMSLKIVGSKMPESMRSLAQPGIEILGFVQDVDPLLRTARISIAPLRYGAGVKGKINQAMAYGLPVVATPVAVEGMYLQHGDNVLVAHTAAEYADAIADAYTDSTLWDRLAAGGKANIEQTFSRAVASKTIGRLLGLTQP